MKSRYMKPLKWPRNSEEAAYMRVREKQNLVKSLQNKNENWMWERLKDTGIRWRRSVKWGYRIFDFWCHDLGIAVEVDGPEHDIRYDNYRDEYNYRRNGILVLRVKNGDEFSADRAVEIIKSSETWKERKARLGILGSTKAAKRSLVSGQAVLI